MEWAHLLLRARHRAGVTQRQLAGRTGIAQPTIARIERSQTVPRLDTYSRLLAGCGHRLELVRSGGEGVDHSLIRELLALAPAQRLERAVADAAALTPFPVGALARRRASRLT